MAITNIPLFESTDFFSMDDFNNKIDLVNKNILELNNGANLLFNSLDELNNKINNFPTPTPKNHSSSSQEYGIGNTINYGHVKIEDRIDYEFPSSTGVVPSSRYVNSKMKLLYYIGNGKFGKDNPCHLIFEYTPKLIIFCYIKNPDGTPIYPNIPVNNEVYLSCPMRWGSGQWKNKNGFGAINTSYGQISVGPTGRIALDVYWYNTASAKAQFNELGVEYSYLALF